MPPNLAHFVCQIGSSPPAPPPIFPAGKFVIWRKNATNILTRLRGKYFFHWLFIWIKKLDTEDFEPKQTATKFSANIIWLLVYLFVKISCLRVVLNAAASRRTYKIVRNSRLRVVEGADPYGFAKNFCLRDSNLMVLDFEAEPSQGVRGFGGEKPDFSRSENVALCLFTSKAMAVLRWFLPRENNCIIERAIKLKILAVLFVCENFLLTGRRGRRPLQSCVDNLPKFEVFAVLFRYKHSGAVHQTKGGGNRLKTVGLDNGLDVQEGQAGEV